jgi:hypothetical protein
MVAKQMRSFAAGIILATAICGIVYFSEPSKATSHVKVEKPSEEEMKNELISAGYVIQTEEEWNEHLEAVEALEVQETEEVNEEKPADEGEKAVVYKTILNVSSGMTSIDVGKVLVQANITDDAMKFFNEVEKRGISNDLRPGTYEIDSEMTIDDVISKIFK